MSKNKLQKSSSNDTPSVIDAGVAPTDMQVRKFIMQIIAADACFKADTGEVFFQSTDKDFIGNFPIMSKQVTEYAQYRLHRKYKCVVPLPAITKALTEIKLIKFTSAPHKLNVRCCSVAEAVYIDQGNGRCYHISAEGVKDIRTKKIKFTSRDLAMMLPSYKPGDKTDINKLAAYVPADAMPLVVTFIAMCLIGEPPFANLVLQGEHRSGKTNLCFMIRALTDPSRQPTTSITKVDDLYVNAARNAVIGMDNISSLSDDMSDAMCRLSSGSSYTKRKLYTDSDEIAINVSRPIFINGIDSFVHRSDLADRSIFIHLPPIKKKISEKSLWKRFNADSPEIFGAILKGISYYLGIKDTLKENTTFRVISFTQLGIALEQAFEWESGVFVKSLESMKRRQLIDEVESNALAKAIMILVTGKKKAWRGTSTSLYEQFDSEKRYTPLKKDPRFPNSAVKMGKQLDRIKPLLRELGIKLRRPRTATQRTIVLSKTKWFQPINF